VLTVEQNKNAIAKHFLDNGRFSSTSTFRTVDERYGKSSEEMYFPIIPPSGEEILWQAWVPLSKTARFIEFQIWPPADMPTNSNARTYLYQVELKAKGQATSDGLIKTILTVQNANPTETIALEVPLDPKGDQT
jgi:hypothetical protein